MISTLMEEEKMQRGQMPVGFSMALAQNQEAMQKFATLSEDKKQQIIQGTHSVKSRKEMHHFHVLMLSKFSENIIFNLDKNSVPATFIQHCNGGSSLDNQARKQNTRYLD